MKRKHNPVKETVTRVVSAGKWKREKKPKMTFLDFFEDLQNRGPLAPVTWFETWAIQIKDEMERAGSWKSGNDEHNVRFVAEYISRLQRLFWDAYPGEFDEMDVVGSVRWGGYCQAPRQFRDFKLLYLKIRRWGLVTGQFGLCAWTKSAPLISYVCCHYGKDNYYGNSLYTQYQMWSRYISCGKGSGPRNSLRIDPRGLTVPWRDKVRFL